VDLGSVSRTSLVRGYQRRLATILCAGAIVVLALLVSIVSLALAASPSFSDVPDSHPNKMAILDLASRGIINGYDGGIFKPDNPVIRQGFAKMIVKTLGLTVTGSEICPFGDVDLSPNPIDPSYPAKYVAVCAFYGITTGTSPTTFNPYGNITRQQLITMAVRAAANLAPGSLTAAPAGWSGALSATDPTHGANIKKAEFNGLLAGISGPGGTLISWNTTANATRGEVAQILHNLLGKLIPPSTTTTIPATTTTTVATPRTIEVIGSASFIENTNNALALLQTKSPATHRIVQTYIGIIEQSARSGMWAWEEPPRFEVGDTTSFATSTWYASTIAHDAAHSELYHLGEEWTGVAAEEYCLSVQLSVLTQIGGLPYEIDYLARLTPTYLDLDGDGDIDWDDYELRNW